MPGLDASVSEKLSPTDLRSLRHHHRRRRDEESDSTSSSDSEDEPAAAAPASSVNSHCILVITLIFVAVVAAGLVFWMVNRGYSTSSMATSDSLSNFQSDCLDAHNSFRSTHNASDLVWNNTLADAAEKWAGRCQWKHSEGSLLPTSYGENLFASASDGYRPDDLKVMNTSAGIWAWNNEESMYDYSKPTGFTEETGHFTQTVWKGTSAVGCFFQMCKGIFQSGQYGVYLVCEYWPPGNLVTDDLKYFKENVQAPS